jgi:glycosyltransferase involved in cell wall biosynthesis
MRVLILNYEYPPLGGGAGVATQALARGLASRGVTVDVITAGERDECRSEVLWDGHASEEGMLTVYRLQCNRKGIHEAGMGGAFSYLRTALPLVRARMRDEHYDLVHVFFSLPTGAMLPFLSLGDTPVIVSLRGSDVPGYDPYQRTLERVHQVLRPLTRWIWRRANRVVAVCESLGRLALRTDPDLSYSVIPNGVDLTRFRPSTRARSRHRKIRCLVVARLVERKGIADLIQAIASLERGRFELEIVGSGPDEQKLRELARILGVSNEVVFAGSVDRADIAGRYRDADIFTLASWEEAFGNVFAEALASGLPIVGSSVGGIPELVEHGKNGFLVPPREPRALAAAIRHLADHPELRAEIGRRNRAQAESNLSWARVTTRYLSVYNGVLRRAPARPRLAELPSSTW